MRRFCLVCLAGLFVCLPAHADRPDDRAAIARLAEALKAAAPRQTDPQALAEARRLMRRALNRLEHGARQDRRGGCVRYVQPIYAQAYPEASAMERAIATCKTPVDTRLLQFAQPIYAQAYNAISALERALKFARRPDLRRRMPMVRFAYDVYRGAYTTISALDRAAKFASRLPRRHDGCVRSAYPTYLKAYTATSALERAARTCAD